jgi:hypothetical protein
VRCDVISAKKHEKIESALLKKFHSFDSRFLIIGDASQVVFYRILASN